MRQFVQLLGQDVILCDFGRALRLRVLRSTLRLVLQHPGLAQDRAVVWASAVINQLPLVTCDPRGLPEGNPLILVAYVGDGY